MPQFVEGALFNRELIGAMNFNCVRDGAGYELSEILKGHYESTITARLLPTGCLLSSVHMIYFVRVTGNSHAVN